MRKSALAQSQYPIYSGNVYLGKDRHSWCEQCFQFGRIRDILNSREVADMVIVPDKEIAKLKEPVMARWLGGVVSARIHHGKLVDPPA